MKKDKFVIGFLCWDGSFRVIFRSKFYDNYETADQARKELQPDYKHVLEVKQINRS